mgnify:CR=1 FL=1
MIPFMSMYYCIYMVGHLQKHYFFYGVISLLILSIAASFFRFMVAYDYSVRYEGECDPYSQSCYQFCEDEGCSEPFYYSWITAHGKNIVDNCNEDITTCDYAYNCVDTGDCILSYCDPEVEECEVLTEQDRPTNL